MPPKRPTTVPPIPLDFKEAVTRLLRVKPAPEKKKRGAAKKKSQAKP